MSRPLSDRFFLEVARLGARRRTDPVHFLAVWCAESGLDPAAVNPSGGARGLNQMMPETLRWLGAPANFERLSAEQQLPWIERLIAQSEALIGGPFSSAARYYHANFFPATLARGGAPNTVVVARDANSALERSAYAANVGLDVDHDGAITLADLDAVLLRVRRRHAESVARLAAAVEALQPHEPDQAPRPARARGLEVWIGVAMALGALGIAMHPGARAALRGVR